MFGFLNCFCLCKCNMQNELGPTEITTDHQIPDVSLEDIYVYTSTL
jgi:hypothetical protein